MRIREREREEVKVWGERGRNSVTKQVLVFYFNKEQRVLLWFLITDFESKEPSKISPECKYISIGRRS